MSTTNGLTKSLWAEFVQHSGEGVFAITHAIYNPSYVEWLESELRAARQKIKVAEQTPTNKQIMPLPPSCGECPHQRTCKQHGGIPYAYGGLECVNIRRAETAGVCRPVVGHRAGLL